MTDSDATQGDNMSPAEFAKLMGAYPQPAENPLPTYGGYMDNSAANFSWVQNNDYFGAEEYSSSELEQMDEGSIQGVLFSIIQENGLEDEYCEMWEMDDLSSIVEQYGYKDAIDEIMEIQIKAKSAESEEKEMMDLLTKGKVALKQFVAYDDRDFKDFCKEEDLDYNDPNALQEYVETYDDVALIEMLKDDEQGRYYELKESFGAETEGWVLYSPRMGRSGVFTTKDDAEKVKNWYMGNAPPHYNIENTMKIVPANANDDELDNRSKQILLVGMRYDAETFEAPYGGAGSLMDIGKSTPLDSFTTTELTTSSAIHGDFDEASLNYSGHQNLEVRAETVNGISAEEYYAEMEELTEGVASITNRFGDGVGIIQVDDEDLEDVSVEITDGDGDVVYEGILGDEDTPEMEEDDFYYSENKKKSSILPMALGIAGAIFAYQPMMDFLSRKTKKEEKMAENPELIENPNTGNLDPAQYEEMIVESTGYSVDVIPQVLDGSFMGSRFAALPTERYVEYNEPGIGAHTDIAMNRDEMYLEPEMAMVQASESIKESQAPGQSPYNSTTGEENPDFDVRVLKETTVVSLDPAVKPFIPQSMSGYTGNANTPPSVYDKMFNIGVLGQTPSFVPGSGDIGSSHTGSRSAIPNSLGIAGAVGGPLSDQVNANYTDGQTSMSLAQWAIENTVSQTSDTEAVVIDRSSGAMKRVRRV
jgi:hypothetical protein